MSTKLTFFFIFSILIIIENSDKQDITSLKSEKNLSIQNPIPIRQLQDLNITGTNVTIYSMNFYEIELLSNKLKLYCESTPKTPDNLYLWLRLIINEQNEIIKEINYTKEEIGVLAKKTEENEYYEIFSSSLELLNFDEIMTIKVKNIIEDSYDNNSIYDITFSDDLYVIYLKGNSTPDSFEDGKNGTEYPDYIPKSGETKGTLSVGIILGIIAGVIFLIILVTVIICLCCRKKKQIKETINDLDETEADLSIEKYIFEREKPKVNPRTFLFLTTGQMKLYITIEADKKMEDLIKFYFQIIKKPNLYNDKDIIFVKDARTINHNCKDSVAQYFKEKNSNVIMVVDQEDKLSQTLLK
mgnify:CR=1 FL=1